MSGPDTVLTVDLWRGDAGGLVRPFVPVDPGQTIFSPPRPHPTRWR